MSKYVKNLLAEDLKQNLEGVGDALVVNVVGLDANKTTVLRKEFREKNIRVMVVKNSMARRATEGTPLALAFEGLEGNAAIVWGAEDVVMLAKEVMRFAGDKEFAAFTSLGGVMDGQPLSSEEVAAISKWPSRGEMLSIVAGQIMGPGASLTAQIGGPGETLVGQINSKGEETTGE